MPVDLLDNLYVIKFANRIGMSIEFFRSYETDILVIVDQCKQWCQHRGFRFIFVQPFLTNITDLGQTTKKPQPDA